MVAYLYHLEKSLLRNLQTQKSREDYQINKKRIRKLEVIINKSRDLSSIVTYK